MFYYVEEQYRIQCSRTEINRLFHSFPMWAGTSSHAKAVYDFDMGTGSPKDGSPHTVDFSCSFEHIPHSSDIVTHQSDFEQWAAGVGHAAQKAHEVVSMFLSRHDEGTWQVLKGHTTVSSSAGEDDDIEDAHLTMTLHHTQKDLLMLYSNPDEAAWSSHYR